MSKGRKQRRGGNRRERRTFIGVWVPGPMAAAVDKVARRLRLDRSDFLRSALEGMVTRKGGMEGNTDRFTRVLLLWLELHSAVALARSRPEHAKRPACAPGDSRDAKVREVWRKLTDPTHLLALEQWLCQSADGQPAEWARQALRVSRERSRLRDPAAS